MEITIKTFGKFWNILLYFIIFIEILLLVMFALPNLFRIKVFTVSSGSMIPRYDIGSIVYVKAVKPSDIEVGDSISFYMQNTSTVATHEVYEISDDRTIFRTQGINNKDEKGAIIHDANPVAYNEIIGKVICSMPYVGIIYGFISCIPVLCTLIAITIFMIFISCYISKRKETNVKNKSNKINF